MDSGLGNLHAQPPALGDEGLQLLLGGRQDGFRLGAQGLEVQLGIHR